MIHLHVLGFGYTAQRFVALFGEGFDRITATVRSPEAAAALTQGPVTVRAFADPAADADAEGCDALLVSVPPGEGGDPALQRFGPALERAPKPRWIGYLSTTGVYGDRGGGWVDERTAPRPGSPRAVARVKAERGWTALGERSGGTVQLFRLAGIYGPGRNLLLELSRGTARRVVKPGYVSNRIHADDIAGALAASLERPRHGAVYNIADDEPAPPQEVVAFAAELMGLPPPPEQPIEAAELSPMARSFYAESRRVSTVRTTAELRLRLRYPTYRIGLAALWAAGEGRGAG